MKITAIIGSLRRGNTYTMVEAACNELSGCDIIPYHLKNLSISPCNGCLKCDANKKCYMDDDMDKVINDILSSEGLILGTPARWSLLSGELKIFFDRLNPLAVPDLLKGKKAIIFSVGQSKIYDTASIESAAKSIVSFCENAGIEVIETVLAHSCLNSDDLVVNNPDAITACKEAAKKLYRILL